jgi:tRNA A-37 threonylcarbamoyl transferase component Bud32
MTRESLANGRYQLSRRIGTGGTADVYEARDTAGNRTVAIKLIHARQLEDETLAGRLQAEVRMSRTLHHPGAVEVYEYETHEEQAYLVMEYMPGGDLRKRILSVGRLPPSEVVRIARAVLETLSHAHAEGIVHRDLKPRNILFDAAGAPRIADFGLARSVTAAGLHQQGTIAGTPEYTAPETVTSSLWDARSDLYALGCTLFETLTGNPPFVANTQAEVLRLQVEARPPSVAKHAETHPALVRLLESLLEKDPNSRPQTAEEALRILDRDTPSIEVSSATESCPSCGAPMSAHYGWCFTCGRPNLPAQYRRGGYAVMITGPGKSGEKFTPEMRDECCSVAEAAALDPAPMRKHVPRLPFVFASSVDYGGARRLAGELASRGMEVALVGASEKPRSALIAAAARKALTMAPRVYLVALGMGGAWFNIVRSIPPVALLVGFGSLLAAVPIIMTAAFMQPRAKWEERHSAAGGDNLTRLLADVRDPLIHARMKSIAESAYLIVEQMEKSSVVPEADRKAVREWADATVDRVAGLCLALNDVRTSTRYATQALAAPAQSQEEDAMLIRRADAVQTRILEMIGSAALEVRELAARSAAAGRSSAAVSIGELRAVVMRFADEGAAWRELAELPGASA